MSIESSSYSRMIFISSGKRWRQRSERETMFNIIHNAFVIKVDIVIRKENEFRFQEFSRKQRISVEGHEMFIVAPEDLILSKLEWAKNTRSEVQLADVRNLLTGVEGLDRNYLTRWANRLGLESLYREVGG